jgi:hypothetical protein
MKNGFTIVRCFPPGRDVLFTKLQALAVRMSPLKTVPYTLGRTDATGVGHLLSLLQVAPFHRVQIPQHSFDRPDKPLFNPTCLSMFNGNEILNKCHTCIRTNSCENMPPPMQLEEEAPG